MHLFLIYGFLCSIIFKKESYEVFYLTNCCMELLPKHMAAQCHALTKMRLSIFVNIFMM